MDRRNTRCSWQYFWSHNFTGEAFIVSSTEKGGIRFDWPGGGETLNIEISSWTSLRKWLKPPWWRTCFRASSTMRLSPLVIDRAVLYRVDPKVMGQGMGPVLAMLRVRKTWAITWWMSPGLFNLLSTFVRSSFHFLYAFQHDSSDVPICFRCRIANSGALRTIQLVEFSLEKCTAVNTDLLKIRQSNLNAFASDSVGCDEGRSSGERELSGWQLKDCAQYEAWTETSNEISNQAPRSKNSKHKQSASQVKKDTNNNEASLHHTPLSNYSDDSVQTFTGK